MKTKFDDEELNLVSLAKEYSNEKRARKLFEALRWPGGKPVCPHCGFEETYKLTSKAESKTKLRAGVYCCAACRKPFTATVGTVFENSHVPISKILMAIFILCSSKKSISAMQLSRMLKTTYRTAWFLAHRIRFAMGTDLKTAKPLDNTCEADETFCQNFENTDRKVCVALVLERDGQSRARVIPSVTSKTIGKFMAECVSKTAIVNTDEHAAYRQPLKDYKRHDRVVHSRFEYARHNPDGTVSHVNTCESWFSLLKRGVFGAWHCVSREHLAKYANEFEYRWNTRKQTDGERMVNFVPMIAGKRLMYRQPKN
jgi:transposase-like protein